MTRTKLSQSQRKRILIATDAWYPQVNGVVRTLESVVNELRKSGHEVKIFSHGGKKTWDLPSYPEIQLAFCSRGEVNALMAGFQPDFIHIATEGPIGLAMRKYCERNNLDYTTGFHTRFAEYAEARIPLHFVKVIVYRILRWFHKNSSAILAPTKTVSLELEKRGFKNVVTWTRGVDQETFKPCAKHHAAGLERPVLVYVGRISVEKGIEDFLKLESPGTKLVIGDGPMKHLLEEKYSEAVFTGYLFGKELAQKIATGDVFVFPSKTDTFGLVMLEAMACGLPVAAYPVMGPIDVVIDGYSGALDDDLDQAVTRALELDRNKVIEYASRYSWQKTAQQFFDNLTPITTGR